MGWYHDPNFDWGEGDAAPACSLSDKPKDEAPSCSIKNKPNVISPPSAAAASTATVSGNTACPLPVDSPPPPPPPDVECIYHLCQKSKWKEAKGNKQPYFPPSYMKDGKFTRATVFKSDLVSTANEFYKDTPEDWMVLEISCEILYSFGIPIMAQDAPESTPKQPVKCLQVFGGISTTVPGLIIKTYTMKRAGDGTFLKVVDPPIMRHRMEEEKKEEAPSRKQTKKPIATKKPKEKTRRFWPMMKK